jgi:hypothetical protein
MGDLAGVATALTDDCSLAIYRIWQGKELDPSGERCAVRR